MRPRSSVGRPPPAPSFLRKRAGANANANAAGGTTTTAATTTSFSSPLRRPVAAPPPPRQKRSAAYLLAERAGMALVRTLFLSLVLAWALTKTSSSLWINLPLAVLVLLAARHSARTASAAAASAASGGRLAVPRFGPAAVASTTSSTAAAPPPSNSRRRAAANAASAAASAVASAASAAVSALLPPGSSSSSSIAGQAPTSLPSASVAAWPPPATAPTTAPSPLAADAADARWREAVGNAEVERAWEALSGAVVQEFIYDSWWSSLSPDVDFPAAVRGAINAAFGEVARAARGLDVRRLLLGEGAELLMEHLQMYRDARDSAIARHLNASASKGGGLDEWRALPESTREELLKIELAAAGNLHPALLPPRTSLGGETTTASLSTATSATATIHPALSAASAEWPGRFVGHYAVLRRVSEGVAASVLDRSDFNHPLLRSVVRELLASAVLRPVVWTFAPHSVRRHALLAILRGGGAVAAVGSGSSGVGSGGGGGATAAAAASNNGGNTSRPGTITEANAPPGLFPPRVPLQGLWDFEQRLRASIAAEESARRVGGSARQSFSSPVRDAADGFLSSSPSAGGCSPSLVAPRTVPRAGPGASSPASLLPRSASDQGLMQRAGADATPAATAPPMRAASPAVAVPENGGGADDPDNRGDRGGSRSVPPSPDRSRLTAPPLFPPEAPDSAAAAAASPVRGGWSAVISGSSSKRDTLSPLPGEKGRGGRANGDGGGSNIKGFRSVRSRHRRAASTSAVDNSAEASRLALAAAAAAAAAAAEAASAREQNDFIAAPPYSNDFGNADDDDDESASDAASRRSVDSSATGGAISSSAGLPSPGGIDASRHHAFVGGGNNLSATLSLQQFPSSHSSGGGVGDPTRALLGSSSHDNARGSRQQHPTGPSGDTYFGFLGRPRAKVVAADVDSSGPKDVVLFLVRVADGRGEWAVTRRHRHFEALHRTLKDVSGGAYRLRLPNRRAFGATQTPEAVEERRRQLDAYLWRVLAEPSLCQRKEVWDFLSAWGAPPPLAPGFLKQAAASIRGAPAAARRATVGAAVAVAGVAGAAVDLTVGAAVGAVGDAVAAASAARREAREKGGSVGGAGSGGSTSAGGVGGGSAGHKRTPSRGFLRPPPLDVSANGDAAAAAASNPSQVLSNASTPSRLGGGGRLGFQRGEGSGRGAGVEEERRGNDGNGAAAATFDSEDFLPSGRQTPRQSQATTPDVTPASGPSACDSPRGGSGGATAAAEEEARAVDGDASASEIAAARAAVSPSSSNHAAAVGSSSPPPPGSRAPAGTPADSASATPARSSLKSGNVVGGIVRPSAASSSRSVPASSTVATTANGDSEAASSVGSANADGSDARRGAATAAAAAAALRSTTSSSRLASAPPPAPLALDDGGDDPAPSTLDRRNSIGRSASSPALAPESPRARQRVDSSDTDFDGRGRGMSDDDVDVDEDLFEDAASPLAGARARAASEQLLQKDSKPNRAKKEASAPPRPTSATALARGFASALADAVLAGGGGSGDAARDGDDNEEDGATIAASSSSPLDTGHISFSGVALPRADDLTTVAGRGGTGAGSGVGTSDDFAPPLSSTTSIAAGAFASALGGIIPTATTSTSSASGYQAATSAVDWEEVAGASAPLYELVGAVFELHRRGFFRRQVFGVARQALSLVAGGAIDDWMLRKLRTLKKPGTLAAALLRLQASLWPGGVWFVRAPAAAAAACTAAAAAAAAAEGTAPPKPLPPPQLGADGRPRWRPVTEASYMTPSEAALAGSEEIAAALRSALLGAGVADFPSSSAASSNNSSNNPGLQLVARLVGREAYRSGVSDVLDMISSPTIMLSLGHAALKVVVVSLFPRLKPLYSEIEGGGSGGR